MATRCPPRATAVASAAVHVDWSSRRYVWPPNESGPAMVPSVFVVVVELVVTVVLVVVLVVGGSDLALNFVGVFNVAVEKIAPQHAPSEVLYCAMTLGFFCMGMPSAGLPLAFTCTFAFSGRVEPLSPTPVIPSGAPGVPLSLQPVAVCVQIPPAEPDGLPRIART